MAELILVRHAKSDWSDPSLRDHDRPLNGRGRKNAPEMADRLASTGVAVDLILSSTAVRARTTAEAFVEALDAPLELVPELYLASGSTLLGAARLAATRNDLETIMVVAHDPGITELANELSSGGIRHMPTAAVARFELAEGWDAQKLDVDAWDYDTVRGIADPEYRRTGARRDAQILQREGPADDLDPLVEWAARHYGEIVTD